jgi:hypothetical protein
MTPLRWSFLLAAAAACSVGWAACEQAPQRTAPPQSIDNQAFRSAASADARAVVWAVGDGADGSDAARALARRIAAGRPDRFLYLGDVYEHGTRQEFRTHYRTVYGRLAAITAPTPGNHDWPSHADGYDPYWRSKTGRRTPPWYAFRIGGWRVISLNSEAPHGAGSAQVRWLRARMARTAGTCTLAFWHRPLQSAGFHGDQPDVAPLWNALRGHARLVVNGHDHDLQRLRPRDGITALVAGAGGHSHYPLSDDPRVVFGDDQRYGALRLVLRRGGARLAFVSTAGKVLDRSSVACTPR